MTWRDEAECRTHDPELFFASGDSPSTVYKAKIVCYRCPVRKPCLDDAMATAEPFGIRGGMTERERHRLWSATRWG